MFFFSLHSSIILLSRCFPSFKAFLRIYLNLLHLFCNHRNHPQFIHFYSYLRLKHFVSIHLCRLKFLFKHVRKVKEHFYNVSLFNKYRTVLNAVKNKKESHIWYKKGVLANQSWAWCWVRGRWLYIYSRVLGNAKIRITLFVIPECCPKPQAGE